MSDNGFLSGTIKRLPEPILNYHKWGFCGIQWYSLKNNFTSSYCSLTGVWKLDIKSTATPTSGQWVKVQTPFRGLWVHCASWIDENNRYMWPLVLTWFHLIPAWRITSIIMCGVKLFVHSQTSTVHPLKFGNGYVISLDTLLGMWLLIHAVIKVNLF